MREASEYEVFDQRRSIRLAVLLGSLLGLLLGADKDATGQYNSRSLMPIVVSYALLIHLARLCLRFACVFNSYVQAANGTLCSIEQFSLNNVQ